MGLGGSIVRMHHALKMKNLMYSASVTRQPDRRKGVNLAKKCVKISIPLVYITYIINLYFCWSVLW